MVTNDIINTNKKMKASIRRRYGSPHQIEIAHIQKPIPKYNAILLKFNQRP
ncbi:MAG: hypothetical protein ACI849_001527 [Patiriisocius sp.]|jgi:hypothetical protein